MRERTSTNDTSGIFWSADWALGVPFNIASYALLTHMIAHCLNMGVGDFIHTFGDYHLYSNQIEGFKEQLTREPMPLPKLILNPSQRDLFNFTLDDITIMDYQHHSKINFGPVAV